MALHLKDWLSLANAVCGLLAIVLFFSFGYFPAFALVALAIIFDFLDGIVARRANARDGFGKQLDSLADAVSFGLAPALLIFLHHYPQDNWGFFLLLLGAAVFLGAALLRLAKYNLQKESGAYYGLPSPLAAFFLLLLGWTSFWAGALLLFLLGALMLSPFKFRKVF